MRLRTRSDRGASAHVFPRFAPNWRHLISHFRINLLNVDADSAAAVVIRRDVGSGGGESPVLRTVRPLAKAGADRPRALSAANMSAVMEASERLRRVRRSISLSDRLDPTDRPAARARDGRPSASGDEQPTGGRDGGRNDGNGDTSAGASRRDRSWRRFSGPASGGRPSGGRDSRVRAAARMGRERLPAAPKAAAELVRARLALAGTLSARGGVSGGSAGGRQTPSQRPLGRWPRQPRGPALNRPAG